MPEQTPFLPGEHLTLNTLLHRVLDYHKEFFRLPPLESPDDEARRRQILDAAEETFRRFGTRRVTMDELSRNLHMSKKTVYKYFDSKEALVRACIGRTTDMIFQTIVTSMSEATTTRDRLQGLQGGLREVGMLLSAPMLTDLKSEFPHLWEEIDSRRAMMMGALESLYEDGLRTGEIHPSIHPKVAVAIHFALMHEIMHPDVFARGEFTPQQAIETVVTLMSQGVFAPATEKGNTP